MEQLISGVTDNFIAFMLNRPELTFKYRKQSASLYRRYASHFSLRKSCMGFYAAKTNINILDTLQNSLIRMIVKATRYMRNDDI
ncbi:hypothetical protein TNCV_4451201, partial [Trichonephila clavipes]